MPLWQGALCERSGRRSSLCNNPYWVLGDPRVNFLRDNYMNDISFVSLSDVAEDDIVALMNNAEVGKQMPLLAGGFSNEICRAFLDAKKQMWEQHGYGPWAFLIKGEFAGWGGLQPEHGDADFALVLHPRFWGWGGKIFAKVRERAFGEMGLDSFTILFPPSRLNAKAITRIGFTREDSVMVDGVEFVRYRLTRPFD
jgi:ribosomal-protein-alanine N-acetyltransferase